MGTLYVNRLPFEDSIKQKLERLVQIVLTAVIDCKCIVLFGSFARAEQTVHSDLDILVISGDEVPREVRGSLCSVFDEENADLLFYREEVFYGSTALIVTQIKKEGVLLWKC